MTLEESTMILGIEKDEDSSHSVINDRLLDLYKKNGPHSKSSPYIFERILAAYYV